MGISVIGAAGEGNNFSIDVGSSGNDVVVFDREFAAGAYSITSQLADTTLDIYAVNSDGTLAGYTNTKALSCSKGFSKVVIYGATTNDLLTFEFKTTFSPTQSGTLNSGAAPYITSASPSDLPDIDDTTTVTGGNFATNVEVSFTGTNDVALPAKNIVRSSSTSLIVTRPDALIQDHSPYDVAVSNPGIANPTGSNVNKLADGVSAGGDPVWVTSAGALTGATAGSAYTTTLSATDPDGGTIAYSLVTGQLPTGLTLNGSTGVVSGTPTGGNQTFTVAATDSGGNITNRSFSIAVDFATGGTITEVSGFRIHTFTNSGTFNALAAISVDALIVAGGGGGGHSNVDGTQSSGGGAGGLLRPVSYSLAAGSYVVTIGAGGAPTADGTNTTALGLVALKGGKGGGGGGLAGGGGVDLFGSGGGQGGSGGGGSPTNAQGTPGQGFQGGSGTFGSGLDAAGGGGGAGGAGGNASGSTAGSGGIGVFDSISGISVGYAGGAGNNEDLGYGGGFNGSSESRAGKTNRGGGGKGNLASGGSGVVIIRYPI